MSNDLMTRANYHLNRGSNRPDDSTDWMMEKKFEYAINERNHWWRLQLAKENNASAERVAKYKFEATIDSNQTARYVSDNKRFGGRTEATEEDINNMFNFDKGEITDEKITVTDFN